MLQVWASPPLDGAAERPVAQVGTFEAVSDRAFGLIAPDDTPLRPDIAPGTVLIVEP